MQDKLLIEGLRIPTTIGIYPWEQAIKQTVVFDIEIVLPATSISDDINRTIDYETLIQGLTDFVNTNTDKLIETLAEHTADYILETFNIKSLSLKLSKPHAIKSANNIAVRLSRIPNTV